MNKLRQKKGFTLLEVVVSTLVITILAAGMLGAFVGSKIFFNRTRHRIQAYNFAREALERLRANYAYTDSQMSNGAAHAEAEIGGVIKGELASLEAALTYDVAEQPNGYKEVTSRVSWTEASF